MKIIDKLLKPRHSILAGILLAGCPAALFPEIPEPDDYMGPLTERMVQFSPGEPTINIVFHGHSVPSGYYTGGRVQTFQAYPFLLWETLSERFPEAAIQIITTSIGGENAERGATRFPEDVLGQHPDVVLIDYSLNDRAIGLERAEAGWRQMIEETLSAGIKLILLTPTPDTREALEDPTTPLALHAQQVRDLANEYSVGLVDSYAAFREFLESSPSVQLNDLMAQANHPNEAGHGIVAEALAEWFPVPSSSGSDQLSGDD